jgi:ketopantoate reductase
MLFHTAKIILGHFHHICNGAAPFHINWKKASHPNVAHLSEQQMEFIKSAQRVIKARGKLDVSTYTDLQFVQAILTGIEQKKT